MKCKHCGGKLKKFEMETEGTDILTYGYECKKCGEMFFDKEQSKRAVEDLRKKELLKELPTLSIRQRIIKLSKDRLGLYINKDVARCAKLKPGEAVEVSLLDKKHILLKIAE